MKVSWAPFVYAAVFLALLGYALVTLRGPKGVTGFLAKQRQIEQMEKRNAVLAQENERLREHIARLANSPAQQELEIRQRFKLVHPGDRVFILNSK
ncbi:MAG: septum formation initiator family protein [Acidobacteriia bacterium]|nr:septum formation initiator family protein [Terriglobia bacterium]